MMFDLPDHNTLYQALCSRDATYEGHAFVGVKSTGIFCRLTCPARKPKPENCTFFPDVSQCMEAGFRACKRCHPLEPSALADPNIQTLLTKLEADPSRRWQERDLIALGFDPSTIRRSFKRQYGITFLEMARLSRLRVAAQSIGAGERVIDAQLDAGFESAAAFRAAFGRWLGAAPNHFKEDAMLRADWLETPLGTMVAVADKSALYLLEFADRKALPAELKKLRKMAKGDLGFGRFPAINQVAEELEAFFKGENCGFSTPLGLVGTPFQRDVWRELQNIPAGETCSYSDIARAIGNPTATRAVARANGANPLAIIVPCHRVIGADGTLTGYGGGLWRKQKLIDIEKRMAQSHPF